MLGPAIFSGKWDLMYLYWFAQFLGSSCAALMVQYMYRIGLSAPKRDMISAIDTLSQLQSGMANDKTASGAVLNPIEKS
jgi:glycerol uptake facilitator-like aquaporin